MFNNNSIPNTSPLYGRNDWRSFQQVNPQEVELMMKQKFNSPFIQNSLYQGRDNDPYIELQQILSGCTPSVKQKIMEDNNYIACDNECEKLIKQAVEELIIPQVLMTQNGRIAFENFVGVVKKLKDKYSKEEFEASRKIQSLMQDEVVRRRLEELAQSQSNSEMQQGV